MGTVKLKSLLAAGWKVGDARDFLQLSDEESKLVEFEFSLVDVVKQVPLAARRRS